MGWLQQHLEDFVKPVLGYIPTLPKDYRPLFTPHEKAIIKNMWRAVKCAANGKPILLAGRDVYMFEVLARRENFPTTFRPDISRNTSIHIQEDYSKHYLFDTGFAGSIPRDLKCEHYTMGSSIEASPSTLGITRLYARKHQILLRDTHQVFPRMVGARSLILKVEYTPKYWKRAFHRSERDYCNCVRPQPGDDVSVFSSKDRCCNCLQSITQNKQLGILQELSEPVEFLRAAYLTIEIYTDKSPRFVEGQLPKLADMSGHK